MTRAELIADLQAAVRALEPPFLEPPFLALPEHGFTTENLAYRRGARDAYTKVLVVLMEPEGTP
ncbi:MAG TPA: hypothetical protein VGF65_11095 [Mycobacterium sp.]